MTQLEREQRRTAIDCEQTYRRLLLHPDDGPSPGEVVEWHRRKIRSLYVHVSITTAAMALFVLAVAYHVAQVCR